jgi:hypothetical protein
MQKNFRDSCVGLDHMTPRAVEPLQLEDCLHFLHTALIFEFEFGFDSDYFYFSGFFDAINLIQHGDLQFVVDMP